MVHAGMPSAGRGAVSVCCPEFCVRVCVCGCQGMCVQDLNKATASGANVLPAGKHLLIALNQVVGAQINLRRIS